MAKITNYSEFFSVYLQQHVAKGTTGEAQLDCPLHECRKEKHFYANCESGLWHCKSCDESGNPNTLITKLHEQALLQTTEKQLLFVSKQRSISLETLEKAKVAYDADNDRYYVPFFTYKPKEKRYNDTLNNLGYFQPSLPNIKDRWVIKKGKGLPTYLYNPGIHPTPPSKLARILEGEWDTWAYHDIYPSSQDMILGKGGSGFPVQCMIALSQIDEFYLYCDNDIEGQKQQARTVGVIVQESPNKKIFVLDFSLIEGYKVFDNSAKKVEKSAPKDVRDMWKDIDKRDTIATDLENAMVELDLADVEVQAKEETAPGHIKDVFSVPHVNSFNKYLERMRNAMLYITSENELAIAAVHAVTTTIEIRDQPLWVFLIGPPSSGKTTFIDSFGGKNQWYDCLSKLTAESLVSGWKDNSGEESSYLPSLDNKSLFVKDFTVTLQGTIEAQKKVMGLLTDIYDGYVKIHHGNNKLNEFITYFNMIAGVTPAIHAHSSVHIGERFLRIDWLGKDYDRREYTMRAISNFGKDNEGKKQELSEATLGFSRYLRDKPLDQSIEQHCMNPLGDLAEFIAIIRTKPEMDRFDGLKYRPEPELGPRLAKQLCKIYVGSRHAIGDSYNAFKVLKKIAFDTCHGFPLDIVKFVLANPRATKEEIAEGIGIHTQATYRTLQSLETTGVLIPKKLSLGKKGRPHHCFDINGMLLPALKPELYFDEDILTKTSHPAYRPNPKGPAPRRSSASSSRRVPPRRTRTS